MKIQHVLFAGLLLAVAASQADAGETEDVDRVETEDAEQD